MVPQQETGQKGLTQEEIGQGLDRIGLGPGNVVLVHSAMRTFGHIQGGAETVVNAFLEVLGPSGTLVAPTFTFVHEAEENPLIDPANDRSEMGIISETVRRHPRAIRSTGFRHSFAAIGPRAEVITRVDPALSAFDLRSSFGVMLALDTQIVLAGMTYHASTSHHFAEWFCEVPYRRTIPLDVRVRRPDGSIVRQAMLDYQPKPGDAGAYYDRHTDFNRLGRMLEERGAVGIAAIGNAAVRRFAMRDLIDLAQVEAAADYNIFRVADGTAQEEFAPLDFGRTVLSPPLPDGAGRMNQYQWCVMDEAALQATLK